jgi:hydroxymethylpyrimidine pyrophosphatase-like HAD family hydrolase
MRYLALCTDYDGTLATDGRVLPKTVSALERLLASGRRLVLVTGRELDQLQQVCPRLDLFEYVVAENGALLFHPATGKETPLATRPPDSFVAALRQRGVGRISVGRCIVATWEPHETTVLETIRDLGLELQVIFNKGAVMILPAGVNKATGLASALEKMQLSPHNAVAIGDAENDHALLALCECSAAVANALPTLKSAADIVTIGDRGTGVVELIEELLRDDLASREPQLKRHHILLGTDVQGRKVHIAPHGETLLLVGAPRTGKSGLAAALMERLAEQSYTFCLIDVEGHQNTIAEAAPLGSSRHPPTTDEVVKLLEGADKSGVINLAGLSAPDRIPFFQDLTQKLSQLQARLGHPHWLTIDETHHLLPAARGYREVDGGRATLGNGLLHITERPGLLAREILRSTSLFIATGAQRSTLLEEFCRESGRALPATRLPGMSGDQALAWRPRDPDSTPFAVNITMPKGNFTTTPASTTVAVTAANVRAAKTRRESP